jgi:transketolase
VRNAFITVLTELMRKDEKVVSITADMGFSVFEEIQKEFPTRFFNTGVTEQASVSIAAGLALSGFKVFFYAQAPFATMRCFEQVRLDIGYNDLDVKIVGAASGFYSNQLGVSHFAVEDIALMRLIPGMTVLAPGDPYEAEWATKIAYKLSTPCYIRLTKAGSPVIHKTSLHLELGQMHQLTSGKDATLFVTGSLLPMAVLVKDLLKEQNIDITLLSVPTIKPLDKKMISQAARLTGKIFTLEEHSIVGGLGSAIAEIIADEHLDVNFFRFGLPDKFTSITGTVPFLLDYNGLSPNKIAESIQSIVKN